MDTVQGNKIIAEFMGGVLHKKEANNHSFRIAPKGVKIIPYLVIDRFPLLHKKNPSPAYSNQKG